jgi:hypothetical protein
LKLIARPTLKRQGAAIGAQQARILRGEVLERRAGDHLPEDRRFDFAEVRGRLQPTRTGPDVGDA